MLGQRHLCCQGNYAVADAPYFLQRRFRVGGFWQCCRWEQHCARCSRAQSRKFLVQKEPFVVPLVAVFCGVSAASVPLLQQQHCQSPPTQSSCLTSAMPLLCSQDERPCVGNHVLADGAIIPIFLKQLVPRRLFPPRLCFG
jgi:hypothetical protein